MVMTMACSLFLVMASRAFCYLLFFRVGMIHDNLLVVWLYIPPRIDYWLRRLLP